MSVTLLILLLTFGLLVHPQSFRSLTMNSTNHPLTILVTTHFSYKFSVPFILFDFSKLVIRSVLHFFIFKIQQFANLFQIWLYQDFI